MSRTTPPDIVKDMSNKKRKKTADSVDTAQGDSATKPLRPVENRPKEIGGPKGPEPTRYGDWEKAGRCIDF